MWQLVIILGELVVLTAFLCLGIHLLIKFRKENVININIKNDTQHEITEEEHIPIPEIKDATDIKRPYGFYSSIPNEEIIRSGGDLIPQNLSDSEKEILRMFYNDD